MSKLKYVIYFTILMVNFSSCMVEYVNPGNVAIKNKSGKLGKVKYKGLIIYNEFRTEIIWISTRKNRISSKIKFLTKKEELPFIYETVLFYRINPDKAKSIIEKYGKIFEYEDFIKHVLSSVAKEIIPKYSLNDLRSEVIELSIKEKMNEKLKNSGFIIDDVFITSIYHPYDFTKSTEAKMITKIEKERTRIETEGNKKAKLLIAEGMDDPNESNKKSLTFEERKSFNDQAQNTITKYNSKLFKSIYSQENYFFSSLFRHKPKEVKEIDSLFEEKNKLNLMSRDLEQKKYVQRLSQIDSLVDVKRLEILEKKINSEYSMENIFTLQKKLTDTTYREIILEAKYFMNHKLDSVLKVEALINLELPQTLNGTFKTFFYEEPIHNTGDYMSDIKSDEEFYLSYKERLSKLENVKKKSDFLNHTLYITHLIKEYKEYVPEKFAILIAKQLIKEKYSNNYNETLQTSKINEVYHSEKDTDHIGYELYLEATFNDGNSKKCFYIQFNPWLEVSKFEIISPPYEKHFK